MALTSANKKANVDKFGSYPWPEPPAAAATTTSEVLNTRVSVQELSTGALAELMSKKNLNDLPEQYRVREADRPTLSYNEWADLPIIDFSERFTNEAGLAAKIRKACEEWGFFQLVNHGMPQENVQAFGEQGRNFFGMPAEEKNKMITDKNFCQYRSNHLDKGLGHTNLLWAESLAFKYRPIFNLDELIEKVWPQGNSKMRNAALNFGSGVEKLGDELLDMFAVSLGLSRDYFSKHFVSKRALFLRWNYYPPCPQPSAALGIKGHTDPFLFTLLQQLDDVGGLQIKRDGKWLGVKPVKGAVVVNVGDLLQAWTNDRFKSVEHQVVVNKEQTRLSVAAFTNPADVHLPIVSPPELIDETHPPVYRPFTFGDYLKVKYRPQSESERIAIGHGRQVLERFKLLRSRI